MYRTLTFAIALLLPLAVKAQPPTLNAGPISSNAALNAGDAQYAGGMKCDSTTGNDGTDDTAALQAAINAAQGLTGRTLVLPAGLCSITGVTIRNAVTIQGSGKWQTRISLKSGSTSPAFTISVDTTAFTPSAGFAQVRFVDFSIRSPNRTDAPGQTVAHGISLLKPANSAVTEVALDRMLITGVPGDCMHSLAFNGFVAAFDLECAYPGGYGINANSTTDWTFYGGQIYGAVNDGVLLSGTSGNFRFVSVNFFVNGLTDVNIFNSGPTFVNCMFDITGTDNVRVNNVNGMGVYIVGSELRWAGTSANATYDNLELTASNAGDVYLSGVKFPTPASSTSPNKPLNNIQFTAGNTGHVYLSNTAFDLGPPATAGVTNNVALLGVPSAYGTATNDSAPTGKIGEYVSSQVNAGSAVPLTTATHQAITSVDVTPGDWECVGNIAFVPAGTTTIAGLAVGVNNVDAFPSTPAGGAMTNLVNAFTTGAPQTVQTGPKRYSFAGAQTVYLEAQASFAVSTMSAYGFLGCRRMR